MSQVTEKKIVKTIPTWVHSWHCKKDHENAVGVKEKIIVEYDDGTKEYRDNLKVYEDPKRPFWVTKPEFRNHEDKKEFEDLDKCERFICKDSELEEKLAQAIGFYSRYRTPNLKQLCSNPYVYGADIDTQTIIKQAYLESVPVGTLAVFTRGALDIECEMVDDKRIILITFIHERKIYSVALKTFMKIYINEGVYKDANLEDAKTLVDSLLGNYIKDNNFELEMHIEETELGLIKWIFDKVHECKTDFIGVWNLGFDIPKIIERIQELGADPAEIMCHPDVEKRFRFVDWYEDKAEVQHFTDKWHWLTVSGYSQFLDSMCLYARLRKVSGRESSYSLDEIGQKELGQGKLHFGAITNHQMAQKKNFLKYWAYNINDVLVMMLMEFKNNDMTALSGLSGVSLLSQFSRQTIMVRNNAFAYGKQRGKIPASSGINMFNEFDRAQLKSGGTVLPPDKAVGVGVSICKEFDRNTQTSLLTNDLDVSSMYPSIMSAFNISKETALSTAIQINGHDKYEMESFFGGINQPEINAVDLCHRFFGLPDYTEMAEMLETHMKTVKFKDGTTRVLN